MTFIPEFSYPVITLLSISALCAAIILAFYDPFVRRVYRRSRACRLTVDRPAGEEPKWAAVSVIIYARGESDRLETLLPAVLTQQYEGPFEVIVVNEGDSSDVRNVISALQLANRNLYLTRRRAQSEPQETRAHSRHKGRPLSRGGADHG